MFIFSNSSCAEEIMASPMGLPQEMQPYSGGPSEGSSTAIASAASVSGGTVTGPMHEPSQVKFSNVSDFAIPPLTSSYNAGGSQQSTSSSVSASFCCFSYLSLTHI